MLKNSAIFLSTLLLFSCSKTTDTPSQVTEKYWQAIQQGAVQTAKKFITTNSHSRFDEQVKSLQSIVIDNFVVDKSKTTVTTIINPEAGTPKDEIIFETRLVLENGNWKIDVNHTYVPLPVTKNINQPSLKNKLSNSFIKSIDAMKDVMNDSINELNTILRDGSDEMNKSVLGAIEQLNNKMKESIEQMKKRRRKKTDAPATETGEGLI